MGFAGALDGVDGGRSGRERVPANDRQFLQHLQAVAQVADAGARVVGPAHGTSCDLVAALEGDEEDFGIEAPAFDGLQLKDGLRGGAGEMP